MKLSELIKELTKLQEKRGDLPCYAYTIDHGPFTLDVGFTSARNSETGEPHIALHAVRDY